jgi:hypothetical protein
MAQASKQQAFQILVEGLVQKGISGYIDVIADYMETNDLEAKHISKLISPILEEKLREEAIKNNTITDSGEESKLPL